MSLATRCPACDTVFRVVQDQLRVSEGWVRCGRCTEVFNAVERLVDIDAEAAPQGGAPDTHRERVIDELDRQAVQVPPAPGSSTADIEVDAPARRRAISSDDSAQLRGLDPDAMSPLTSAPPDEPDLRAEPPAFVRHADRAARWRQPRVRGALTGLALLSAGALGAQVALEYRDLIAARWVATRPALEAACRWAGCRIEAPRMIDGLVVESSGLVRVDNTAMYRLSLVLRNRAPIELAAPAIDLSLTDAQGQLIARRVLSLAELGLPQKSLAASSELPMKALLAAAERPVAGYTIEVFYP
jgi:predicted Zn finger-like uncharacterized protein